MLKNLHVVWPVHGRTSLRQLGAGRKGRAHVPCNHLVDALQSQHVHPFGSSKRVPRMELLSRGPSSSIRHSMFIARLGSAS